MVRSFPASRRELAAYALPGLFMGTALVANAARIEEASQILDTSPRGDGLYLLP